MWPASVLHNKILATNAGLNAWIKIAKIVNFRAQNDKLSLCASVKIGCMSGRILNN